MNTPKCPICGSSMRPMFGSSTGKGWNCEKGSWNRSTRRVEGCQGVVWNKGTFIRKEKTPRAADWPGNTAKHNRTEEQGELRRLLSSTPSQRGSRLVVVDAVAGSAKSWSMGDCAEGIWKRVGNAVSEWFMVAFNTNARDSLEGKLPALWPNIGTINSTVGRWQGYNFRSYKKNKVRGVFSDLIKGLPKEDRPNPGPLMAFCERARDMLSYSDNPNDQQFWAEVITGLCCRFPGLAKKLDKKEAAEVVSQYLPQILTTCLADGKVIDLTEQYAKPALDAIKRSGWRPRLEWLEKYHQWTNDDIQHMADLIRSVSVPAVGGVLIDEAQDLSPSQVVAFLAATWKKGELVLVGDDRNGNPGDENYKAGQGIFGWRGAGGGWLTLIPRLWKALTGEGETLNKEGKRPSLSVTFRVPSSGVEYISAFCPRMKSASGRVGEVVEGISAPDAYQCWLDLKDGKTALWLTRRNAPLGKVFMQTLKDRKRVCLRGGGDFASKVDGALFESAGWYNDSGEYSVSLTECLQKMRSEAITEDEDARATGSDDSLAGFLLEIGEAIQADPSILTEAQDDDGNNLKAVASVGNLRRFVTYFANTNAPRVLSTVYRAKGDEADLVVLDDLEAINECWNDDAPERNAVAFVAGTRHKETLLVIGCLRGPVSQDGDDNSGPDREYQEVVAAIKAEPIKPEVKAEPKRKPRVKKEKSIKPLSLFGDDEE